MAEERTTTDQASSPMPRARAAAEPSPAEVTKASKKAAAAKKTTASKKTTAAKKTAASKTTASKKTAAAKKTTATKAAKTTKAANTANAAKPVKTAQSAEITGSTTTPGTPPGAWSAAVREALSNTDQPPYRLAELAVTELGPRATAWANWLRATYPDPPAHGIARLAAHEARQAGWALAAVEAGGPITAVLSLPAAAWVRAMLVLKIAAGYGHDPADPKRAADLIELLDLAPADGPLPGLLAMGRGHRRRLAAIVAARIGVRQTWLLAGLRMLLAGGDLGSELDRLAHRATAYYRHRHGSQDSTPASAASISSPNSP